MLLGTRKLEENDAVVFFPCDFGGNLPQVSRLLGGYRLNGEAAANHRQEDLARGGKQVDLAAVAAAEVVAVQRYSFDS